MSTEIEKKCQILADLWFNYSTDTKFKDFIEYNDIALPLAFCIANEVVDLTPKAEMFIDETFELLLAIFEIEDQGFESLNEILAGGF